MQDALGVVGALGIALHLVAQRSRSLRMRRISLHPDGHPILDRGQQGTGVGAIMGACPKHGLTHIRACRYG